MEFVNVYEDGTRAQAYAKMEFPGTYYLAYRDLPDIILAYTQGRKAIDFGCGAGRSTRFLQKIGFDVVGVDISGDMIKMAREIDPTGNYHLMADGDLEIFADNSRDLVLAVFTFDNIPTAARKMKILQEIRRVLTLEGRLIVLVSSPEIYLHEWASFSTKDFPDNKYAKNGDIVKIIQTDIEDKRPVEDVICNDEAYREIFTGTGFQCIDVYKPLGKESEPFAWINETRVAPWVIYVLKKNERA
ncbi:MAG TPA: class I SAM-dependent methyltransferase [Candidatus Kapabacteria bacterium]|nr:class I SAM-dependent methyltransferase [Candidatus Kapabacteria bacterium]